MAAEVAQSLKNLGKVLFVQCGFWWVVHISVGTE